MNIFQHPRWGKLLSTITRIKPRANKAKTSVTGNIKPKISKMQAQVITKFKSQASRVKEFLAENIQSKFIKVKRRVVTSIKPGLNKVKARLDTGLKPQINKFKLKMPNIKLPFANMKFLQANISQLGIILMLGIFVTTGMIGSIYAADTEETIATTVKAHRVLLNGREAGYVCDQQSAHIVMEEVLQDAAEYYDMEVTTEHNLSFEEVTIVPEQLSTKAELEQSLRLFSQINVNAYVVYANDEIIGTLKHKEDAEQMLNNIMAQYTNDIEQLENVSFQEDVKIVPTPVAFHEVQDIQTVEAKIHEGQETVEEYIVKEGDTFWSISKQFQIDHEELIQMNADVNPDKLQLGQKIRLSYPKSLLNVVTTEVIEYEKSIPFQTETKKDSSMFSNQTKVIQDGKEGLKNVEARIIKVNGIEQEKEILSETIIEEPVNKIVAKGTKTPVTKGSGKLSWPVKGRLTSRFGRRWGRMHRGIDIANSKGTPIYAADSGKVTFSGWEGAYGNLVKIDHGGGMVTYYAHMSKRAVSKGNSVSKGQLIGYVGSTGRSTGPHLHFEVRINDVAKNPLNYLP